MIRTNCRVRLCCTLLILNLAFIWGNSLMPGHISGMLSDWVKDILSVLTGSKPGTPGGGGLLRKLAHFTEFACLGMCLRWLFGMLRSKNWEHWLFPLLSGILVACLDETIQIFVPNRGPAIKDVGIDTLGATLGIVIISLIQIIKTHKKHLEEIKT